MENLDLAKNIVKTKILTQNACESFDKSHNKKDSLPINIKILYMIQDYGKVSPTLLIDKLYIAKSNLALMCKQLIADGLIESQQDLVDRRIIYYSLTEKGAEYLGTKLIGIQKNIEKTMSQEDLEQLNTHLQQINKILSKKF